MTLTEAKKSNLPDRVKAVCMTLTNYPETVVVGELTEDRQKGLGIPIVKDRQVVAYRVTENITKQVSSEEELIDLANAIKIEQYFKGSTLSKYNRALSKLLRNNQESKG